MSNLRKILLAGSFILGMASCKLEENNYNARLTKEDFSNAQWIKAPYLGEIWTSYMDEKIGHGEANWKMYCEQVAKKNKATCKKIPGLSPDRNVKIRGIKSESILLPDLDQDGSVKYKKTNSYRVNHSTL